MREQRKDASLQRAKKKDQFVKTFFSSSHYLFLSFPLDLIHRCIDDREKEKKKKKRKQEGARNGSAARDILVMQVGR